MRIQADNGQWWTGMCWGVEQAAEVYASTNDMPDKIPHPTASGMLALYVRGLASDDAVYVSVHETRDTGIHASVKP